jgi:hypothetical protein
MDAGATAMADISPRRSGVVWRSNGRGVEVWKCCYDRS